MKVCIIGLDYHGLGVLGGYGRITRTLAHELSARDVDVTVVAPRLRNQPAESRDARVRLLTFPLNRPLLAKRMLRRADAQVYHSQELSIGTFLAQRAMPHRKHVVTVHEPHPTRDWTDRVADGRLAGWVRGLRNRTYRDNPLVWGSVRRADAVFTGARQLARPVMARFRLSAEPGFLPVPVPTPGASEKSPHPTVLWLGPLDSTDIAEEILPLAREFPHVQFTLLERGSAATSGNGSPASILGASAFGGRPSNLKVVSGSNGTSSHAFTKVLRRSWVLLDTSRTEGLTNQLLDAAMHGTAILARTDPDGFASNFGYFANADFAEGLTWLLKDGRWRERAELGREYVARTFGAARAGTRHVDVYQALLDSAAPGRAG